MIFTGLSNYAMWLIGLIFNGFEFLSLPLGLISTLIEFMNFGSFIIGGDLMSLVFGSVFFWLSFKFTAGLVLFVYRLIPLT